MERFFTVVAVSCLVVTEARATPRSAADCDALVRAQPRALASYRCYWDLAHTGRQAEAERGLEAILRREPENPGALHFLGLCWDGRGLLSQDLLRRSIAAYQRAGDAEGEGYARISLFGVECLAARRCDENLEQLDAVDTLAHEHALPELQALSLVYRAGAATMNDDVGAAERHHLRKAESVIGPGGPSWLRARVLERFGFYGSLARGASLAEAMAEARRERIRAGDAPAAWAGMIVLGDGAIRPLAERRAEDRARALWTLTLSAVAGLALLTALRIRA